MVCVAFKNEVKMSAVLVFVKLVVIRVRQLGELRYGWHLLYRITGENKYIFRN
jgi:hypothetical protein